MPRDAGRKAYVAKHRIYTMSFAGVYPLYLAKAEKKGRTKTEVDEIIRWLAGYTQSRLDGQLSKKMTLKLFLRMPPR